MILRRDDPLPGGSPPGRGTRYIYIMRRASGADGAGVWERFVSSPRRDALAAYGIL